MASELADSKAFHPITERNCAHSGLSQANEQGTVVNSDYTHNEAKPSCSPTPADPSLLQHPKVRSRYEVDTFSRLIDRPVNQVRLDARFHLLHAYCLLLQLALHDFLYSPQDLVLGQLAGIKQDRVTGRDQRGRSAGAITAIAFPEFRGQGLRGLA